MTTERGRRRGRHAIVAAALAVAHAAALSGAAVAAPAFGASAPAGPAGLRPRPSASAVLDAASAVRADPDFGGPRPDREWRLKPRDDSGGSRPAAISDWLRTVVSWLAEGSRVVVWIAGALAIALLAVGARHWLRVRGDALTASRRKLPTHVGTLDIRPESLPDDVAGAADALWRRGDARGALALLYRGLLSRLVHAHGVAIESASTEAEVVALARARLAPLPGAFVARLVAAWTLASWGGRPPDDAAFEVLRAELDRWLPGSVVPSKPSAAAGRSGAAVA